MGCAECCSAAAAAASSSSRPQPRGAVDARQSPASRGFPSVSVPVLSKTTHVACAAASRTAPPLTSTPMRAPTPVPTMTAVGVARPSAQGHATTTTDTPNRSAKRNGSRSSSHVSGTPPKTQPRYQPRNVQVPQKMMNGVNLDATASANCWTGALLSCASSTRRAICATADSPPTASTRIANARPRFVEAANTWSPRALRAGRASPVNADSSRRACASSSTKTTTPSAGTAWPGSTRATSPSRAVSDATVAARHPAASARNAASRPGAVSSSAVARSLAVFLRFSDGRSNASAGRSASNAPTASDVRALARASRYLPSETNVRSIADVSKRRCWWPPMKKQQSNNDATE
mmetsp:Transcript_25611/g.77208  ORF Transcript_25611/g.77208 Transcript_25611/m.77208 type:complete len:349 (-) Transcript_25611:275-1321(-)